MSELRNRILCTKDGKCIILGECELSEHSEAAKARTRENDKYMRPW